jgi:hypothetical protein
VNVSLVELLIMSLAVWEIIEIWRHSSLMASWRARAELLEGRLGELLRCGFCLAPWVSWCVCLVVLLPAPDKKEDFWDWTSWAAVWSMKLLILGFAVARLANLGNDLTHAVCRTPLGNGIELDPAMDGPESNSKNGFEEKELSHDAAEGISSSGNAGSTSARQNDV